MKMKKKTFGFLLGILIVVGAVFGFKNFSQRNFNLNFAVNENQEAQQKNVSENKAEKNKLYISGWLPYWAKDGGIKSLTGKLNLFNEINIFAHSVNSDGTL